MTHLLNQIITVKSFNILVQFCCGALVCVTVANAREQLTITNISAARNYYQEKLNNGLPFGGSSMDFEIPSGELASNVEIRMLAKWLHLRDSLPSLDELSILLDSNNTANRIFCIECLKLIFSKPVDFNPYFPPASQGEKIAQLRSIINAYKVNPPTVNPPSQNQ